MTSSPGRQHKPFDQLAKRILRAIYSRAGTVDNQHEVAADAQQIDTWFRLNPALAAELERIGLLGRMIESPATLFECFHGVPSVDDYRDCVRKQLVADHLDVLQARSNGEPRPPFPRLWILAAGRPERVIRGYALVSRPSWPPAFLEGREDERLGLVVLRELPRTRETLLLRLLGAGEVLKAAMHDLAQLPEDAWERQVAMPSLLALRIEIPHDSADADEQEYLMDSMELYEQWERRVRAEAQREGMREGMQSMKKMLVRLYRARFGAPPPAILNAIDAAQEPETLERWADLFEQKSADEIAAALSS